ncbi:hypothetical protein OG604_48345 [Streptomyces sp. NBC_01231]|nr:hypothetical protein OG604_48345 [Streptomyces sp. NBC_01231]
MPLTPEQRALIAEAMRNVRNATEVHASPMSNEARAMYANAALAQTLAVAAETMSALTDAIREKE